MYEAREKWRKDYNTGLYYARKEGEKEGKKEGKKEGAVLNSQKILINLLKLKFGNTITEEDIKLVQDTADVEKLKSALETILSAGDKNDVLKKLS